MATYLTDEIKLEGKFDGLDFRYITRKDNYIADALAHQASLNTPRPPEVFIKKISNPSETIPIDTDE